MIRAPALEATIETSPTFDPRNTAALAKTAEKDLQDSASRRTGWRLSIQWKSVHPGLGHPQTDRQPDPSAASRAGASLDPSRGARTARGALFLRATLADRGGRPDWELRDDHDPQVD